MVTLPMSMGIYLESLFRISPRDEVSVAWLIDSEDGKITKIVKLLPKCMVREGLTRLSNLEGWAFKMTN